MAALAGIGAGGALGGLVGALAGAGIPEYEAKRYEGHVKDGGVLLSVHCDTSDEIKRAKDFLKATAPGYHPGRGFGREEPICGSGRHARLVL